MLCKIGQLEAFSSNYHNAEVIGFGQAAVDYVAARLSDAYPNIVWMPETSTISAEGDSLKEVRQTYDAAKIAALMERWWMQAFNEVLPEPPEFPELLELARFFGSAPTMKAIERQFGIPYRTLQNWAAGKRPCPAYIRRLLMKAWGWY